MRGLGCKAICFGLPIALFGTLTSCAPSDPAGTDIGTRSRSGRYQVAIPVCPGEVVTRASVFPSAGSQNVGDARWSVSGKVDGGRGAVVIVTLGEQGMFSTTQKPLTTQLKREFTFAFESNIHSEEFVLEGSDFAATSDGKWRTSKGIVRASQLTATLC